MKSPAPKVRRKELTEACARVAAEIDAHELSAANLFSASALAAKARVIEGLRAELAQLRRALTDLGDA